MAYAVRWQLRASRVVFSERDTPRDARSIRPHLARFKRQGAPDSLSRGMSSDVAGLAGPL